MKTVKVSWIDSITVGVLSTVIYRDDVQIGEVATGVQTFDDTTALDGTTYKYEVQGKTATGESTDEVLGVNVDNITISVPPPIITNYVFDGNANSFLKDEVVTPIMLDNIADPSTWVVRMKIDITGGFDIGIIGTENGFGTSLTWETIGNLNEFRTQLRDDGSPILMNNILWGPDTGWNTYFWTYDTTNGQRMYKNTTLIGTNIDTAYTARRPGRILTSGATGLAGTSGKYFVGEMSDMQLYDKILTTQEMANLSADITDVPLTNLKLHFAEKKTATVWTSNVNGNDKLTNQGGVTTN